MDYTALACLIWTCFAYIVAKKIHRKKPLMIFSPVVTVSVSTILLLLAFGINYDTYHKIYPRHRLPAHSGYRCLCRPHL